VPSGQHVSEIAARNIDVELTASLGLASASVVEQRDLRLRTKRLLEKE